MGLIAFGGEFGKWAGSSRKSISKGYVSSEEVMAAINAANRPLSRSLSVDIGGSLDAFSGGSFSAGIAIGTNDNTSGNQDICVYYMLCEHSGIGHAAGLSISWTISGGGIPPGETESKGMMYSGGLLGKFSVSGAKDMNENYSGTLSAGPGIGIYAGELTCSQISRCISEMMMSQYEKQETNYIPHGFNSCFIYIICFNIKT